MLEASDLIVKRGGATLLNKVNFSAEPGTFTAIIGPNGAGKSTFLKAISGEWPHTGTVSIGGRRRTDWDKKALARTVSVMTQSPHIGFDFTVAELVRLGRAPHKGLTIPSENAAMVERAIRTVGLEGLQERSTPALSGGEIQRAFMAKAIVQLISEVDQLPQDNTLLILDEPTSALDLAQQLRAMQAIQAITASGGCVVAVLHDLNLAAGFADIVAVMKEGKIVAHGTPAEVLVADHLAEWYGCPIQVDIRATDQRQIVSVTK